MMNKETLLARLMANSQALAQALEGVPHDELEKPGAIGQRSIKEVCALLTAWDGEALRRIDYITGRCLEPPHDVDDSAYWNNWAEMQVAIKRTMPVRGVLVDMIGTRQRLLTRLAELSDFHIERWLKQDPQATQPYFTDYLAQIQTWRTTWDKAHPAPGGLKKLWQSVKWWQK